jgi:hypothetical protein
MAYAMDNDPPFTIILITGDRDFAYLVSILTLRQYDVVVIVPPNHHISLTYQASAVLDWNTQIMQQPSNPLLQHYPIRYRHPRRNLLASPVPFLCHLQNNPQVRLLSASRYVFSYITEPSELVRAYDLSQLATAVSTLTKKQKRLLKKQLHWGQLVLLEPSHQLQMHMQGESLSSGAHPLRPRLFRTFLTHG